MSSAAASVPADLFQSLQAARKVTANVNAEQDFLAAVPMRLSIWGGFLAYGMANSKPWAKWIGGLGVAWLGVEYFAARRASALAQQAAVVVAQGASSS